MTYLVTKLEQRNFRRTPWKNGGGLTLTIAEVFREDATTMDWDDLVWSFGRTSIVTSAPFSDLAGFERMQVLVEGRGLVLEAPDFTIDVRRPFHPVRFRGDTKIVSRLESGAVEVINLMARRSATEIDLQMFAARKMIQLKSGVHVFYAATGNCEFECAGQRYSLSTGNALRVETDDVFSVEALTGVSIMASVFPK